MLLYRYSCAMFGSVAGPSAHFPTKAALHSSMASLVRFNPIIESLICQKNHHETPSDTAIINMHELWQSRISVCKRSEYYTTLSFAYHPRLALIHQISTKSM